MQLTSKTPQKWVIGKHTIHLGFNMVALLRDSGVNCVSVAQNK